MPKSTRIEIPSGERPLIALAASIKWKHLEDAENSPIGGLDWKAVGPVLDRAVQLDGQIQKIEKQLEQLIQERNG